MGQAAAGNAGKEGDWPSGLARTIAFSDSVVRVCPYDSEDEVGALFNELIALVHIQHELSSMGVFLRGGMAVGDVHFSGTTIFGPALVRAYELESQFASYPRIVIDPAVIEAYVTNPAMRGEAHSMEVDLAYTGQLMKQAEDGLHFVDYLQGIRTELDDLMNYEPLLRRHRDMIVQNASGLKGFNNVRQKYAWLANYHNATTQAQFQAAQEKDLLVDMTQMLYPSIAAEMEEAAKD